MQESVPYFKSFLPSGTSGNTTSKIHMLNEVCRICPQKTVMRHDAVLLHSFSSILIHGFQIFVFEGKDLHLYKRLPTETSLEEINNVPFYQKLKALLLTKQRQ